MTIEDEFMAKLHDAIANWRLIDRRNFERYWLPRRHPSYVDEKWRMFQSNPGTYYASLDEDNRERFYRWLVLGEPVSAHG